MFANEEDYALQTRQTVTNTSKNPIYFSMNLRTDRHELFIMSSATDTYNVAVAHPQPLDTEGNPSLKGTIPAADGVGATEWVAPAALPTADGGKLYVLTGYAKYLRLTPPSGGATAEAVIAYRPLPATSEN